MRSGPIDPSDADRIGKLPPGRRHWVVKLMEQMQVGDTIRIYRTEWNRPNKTPNIYVIQENKKGEKKFVFSEAADGSGWFIDRVE